MQNKIIIGKPSFEDLKQLNVEGEKIIILNVDDNLNLAKQIASCGRKFGIRLVGYTQDARCLPFAIRNNCEVVK